MHSTIKIMITLLYLLPAYQGSYPRPKKPYPLKPPPVPKRSSIVFKVTGNVYPIGNYHVTVNIGNPPKPYRLDIDTGSDLTWVECVTVPCVECLPPYKPGEDQVACVDPLCRAVHFPVTQRCNTPKDRCHYKVEYADHGSSRGVLVKDLFHLQFINGSVAKPRLEFGCSYNREVLSQMEPPYPGGILGLGVGKASILRQLHELGVTKNIVGHCFGSEGNGFLFLGDDLVLLSGVTWTPMSTTKIQKHYSLGNAELYVGVESSGIKDLPIVFDSGSTYTYFNENAYEALLYKLMNDIKEKGLNNANDDKTLPVCWKGSKPFISIQEVEYVFKPIMLRFADSERALFLLYPEAYLIISKYGNVCLGILNGSEVGLENINLIGDISFQDKIVIYDNENQQVGWISANCNQFEVSLFPNMISETNALYEGPEFAPFPDLFL